MRGSWLILAALLGASPGGSAGISTAVPSTAAQPPIEDPQPADAEAFTAVPLGTPSEKRNVVCSSGPDGVASCTRICTADEQPGPGHLCLRPEDVAEIKSGRSVSSQVAFDNDCGSPTSQQHQTVVVTDGDHARMARLISMTVRYNSAGLQARTRQCSFTTTCENRDIIRDKCKVACVSGSWQSLDGKTFPIAAGCDGF